MTLKIIFIDKNKNNNKYNYKNYKYKNYKYKNYFRYKTKINNKQECCKIIIKNLQKLHKILLLINFKVTKILCKIINRNLMFNISKKIIFKGFNM